MSPGIGVGVGLPFVHLRRRGGFSPASLFSSGEEGAWYDPSDLSTLWQDAAGTTPVTAADQPVGRIDDKSGNGNHATQSTAGSRPLYKTAGGLHWLEFDGVDDILRNTSPVLGASVSALTTYVVAETDNTSVRQVALGVSDGGYGSSDQWHLVEPRSLTAFAGVRHKDPSTATREAFSTSATAMNDARVYAGLFVSGEVVRLRENGTQYESSIAASGPGDLSAGLDIGAIWTTMTALPLDGRIYGAMVIGRALTADEKSIMDAYLAAKSGVTL